MSKKHAMLSASGAHRWLACTPSAKLEEMFPATTSEYAEEGTVAHEVAEICALYWVDQIPEVEYENRLAELKKNKWYTADMLNDCQSYAKLIRNKAEGLRLKTGGASVMIETRVDFGPWVPDGFGTADCLILADGYMEVIDFKYGRGKRVDAFENEQMRLYTLGAYNTFGLVYDVHTITMTIFQPRIADGLSSDEISIEDLLLWGQNVVKPKAKLAAAGKGDFAPSAETCKFCRAKDSCRARAEENLKLFDEAPDVCLLTPEEAGALLEKADDIEAWLSDLKAYALRSLLDGSRVPGWKLVEGRSNRKISDPEAAVKALTEKDVDPTLLYKPREMLTLTQLEKDFGKKFIAETLGELIVKPAGAPTLAPESDRQPAYTPEEQILKKFEEE